jgi:hypothetical protein
MFYAVTYAASAKGSTAVAVRCEKCAQKYYYKLTCTAIARGGALYGIGQEKAKRFARRMAKKKLSQMLETEIRAVPCPHCGWYQEEMIPVLRESHLRSLRTCGISFLVVGCICGPIAAMGAIDQISQTGQFGELLYVFGVPAVIGLVVGGILQVVRWHKNARFDPNDPEK